MIPENYLMRKPNRQGYRILAGDSVHQCSDPNIVFEWALIDRGTGKTPCVGHWVQFTIETTPAGYTWEDIEWGYGHYFDTIEEAEVFFHESVVNELTEEIAELQERLASVRKHLREARALLPDEEEYL